MGQKLVNVVLECCNYCVICVEFECLWRERAFRSGNVVSRPAKESEFPTVVVILSDLAS